MTASRPWRDGATPIFNSRPPKPKVRSYDVVRIDYGRIQSFQIISTACLAAETHHHDGRTVPCTGAQGVCWLDHELVGQPRWKAWLAVRGLQDPKPKLLSLTPCAVDFEPRLLDPSFDLRGLTLAVWRVKNHDRGEVRAQIDPTAARLKDLPAAPDLKFLLLRLWEAPPNPQRKDRAGLQELTRADRLTAAAAV